MKRLIVLLTIFAVVNLSSEETPITTQQEMYAFLSKQVCTKFVTKPAIIGESVKQDIGEPASN